MSRQVGIVLAAVLVGAWSPSGGASENAEVAAKHAENAVDELFEVKEHTVDGVRVGMLSILDAIAAAATDAGMTDERKAAIAGARKRISEGSPVDGEAQLALHQCHREINDGKPFRMPKGVGDRDAITAHARRLLESAAPLLRSGKARDAVRALLETLLTILTPVEQG